MKEPAEAHPQPNERQRRVLAQLLPRRRIKCHGDFPFARRNVRFRPGRQQHWITSQRRQSLRGPWQGHLHRRFTSRSRTKHNPSGIGSQHHAVPRLAQPGTNQPFDHWPFRRTPHVGPDGPARHNTPTRRQRFTVHTGLEPGDPWCPIDSLGTRQSG